MLYKAYIKNLKLIRDTYISIITLKLSLLLNSANYAFSDSLIAIKALDLLDMRFKAILSLKEIIINF